MNWLDILIAVFVAGSALFGLRDGLVMQIFRVVSLVLGIVVCARFGDLIARRFVAALEIHEAFAQLLAFTTIFSIISCLLFFVFAYLKAHVNSQGMKVPDHLAGFFLGGAKGVLILGAFMMILIAFPFSADRKDRLSAAIGASVLAPAVSVSIRTVLWAMPEDYREKFDEGVIMLAERARQGVEKIREHETGGAPPAQAGGERQ